jgi:hypothetical protein
VTKQAVIVEYRIEKAFPVIVFSVPFETQSVKLKPTPSISTYVSIPRANRAHSLAKFHSPNRLRPRIGARNFVADGHKHVALQLFVYDERLNHKIVLRLKPIPYKPQIVELASSIRKFSDMQAPRIDIVNYSC